MIITWIIIIITAAVSIPAFGNKELFSRLRFNPYIIKETRQWYRFLFYGMIHADWAHLVINMFVLYSFGEQVEFFMKLYFGAKGNLYFIILYIGGIILSVVPAFEKHKNDSWYNAVGASGAVSAIVFSSIIFWPSSKIMFLLFPFPIPAAVFGVLYLVYSAYMARRASDNIGHDAHFWGALFGVVFTIALKPELAVMFVKQLSEIF
ncbi:MAG: rhomboid family intramembrane serine protease [Bacteroidales bacterium]